MARITVSVDIAAPLERVWTEAADLGSHAEWMADAESIEFPTGQRSGVGTRMRVVTAVGPLRTVDLMEVTEWVEGRSIGVHHQGVVTGTGRFTLAPVAGATRFTWSEELTFPWYLGGPVTALAASPVLGWVWRRNLAGLKSRIEGQLG
jgi:carbon monoxide dehydrogenase subunit G